MTRKAKDTRTWLWYMNKDGEVVAKIFEGKQVNMMIKNGWVDSPAKVKPPKTEKEVRSSK